MPSHSQEIDSRSRDKVPVLATGRPRLLLVDGHSYAYRAFYAIRSLNSPSGRPTNAIYGFIRMLTKIQEIVRPTHLLVMWDGGNAAERMTLLPQYKQQRKEMPSDMEQQLDQIVTWLKASNFGSYIQDGCEADDCIAAMTKRASAAGYEVVVASSDKDFMQLVSDHVWLHIPTDKEQPLWGREHVRAKSSVEPEQIVDWLALIGDTVDNIPGVPGVGPKTASDLLKQFGSIDGIYRRIEEIRSERLRASLQTSAEIVRRNQELVRLNDKVECGPPVEELAVREGDFDALRHLYEGWGFRTLLHELQQARLKKTDFFNQNA
ncbi:MAG: 5-3 exonuclease [Verrucomicrobiales bacterium]|nr:5-3 exonuclease [Verrucomicrobiales bacterium]